MDVLGRFGTLKTRIWFWIFVSIFLQVSKAYIASYRPTGFLQPIFFPKNFLKIVFWTLWVVLEPLRSVFDSEILSVYFYRSQKVILQVTPNRIFTTHFFFKKFLKNCFLDFLGRFGTLKTRFWFWIFVSIFLQVSKAYIASYRPIGYLQPIFFQKIS